MNPQHFTKVRGIAAAVRLHPSFPDKVLLKALRVEMKMDGTPIGAWIEYIDSYNPAMMPAVHSMQMERCYLVDAQVAHAYALVTKQGYAFGVIQIYNHNNNFDIDFHPLPDTVKVPNFGEPDKEEQNMQEMEDYLKIFS